MKSPLDIRGSSGIETTYYEYAILSWMLVAGSWLLRPFDLHALSTPPAFVLDQDQILIGCLNFRANAKKI